jgi:hypothetical protein
MWKYRIKVTEHDSWSGPSTDYELYDTPEEARERINYINAQNTSPVVPDYYVTASGTIEAVEVDKS